MKINAQFVNMPTSEAMEVYSEKQLKKLEKRFPSIISVDVFFKRENDNKNNGRICEMRVRLPGPEIFASSDEKNYELAVKNTISDLEKQLHKRKGVLKPHL